MSEMIERVARAILGERFGGAADWDRESETFRAACRAQARAAFAAMREPTDDMVDAGYNETMMRGARLHWQAMIDEALK